MNINFVFSIVILATTAHYTLYGGDISSFAGQTATLTFTARSNFPKGFEVFGLDSIEYEFPQIIISGVQFHLGGMFSGGARDLSKP